MWNEEKKSTTFSLCWWMSMYIIEIDWCHKKNNIDQTELFAGYFDEITLSSSITFLISFSSDSFLPSFWRGFFNLSLMEMKTNRDARANCKIRKKETEKSICYLSSRLIFSVFCVLLLLLRLMMMILRLLVINRKSCRNSNTSSLFPLLFFSSLLFLFFIYQ